jgi:hypothetical protein
MRWYSYYQQFRGLFYFMSKDTFYFSHDYNSRNDEKIKFLLRKHGFIGYGLFWAIIEDLYNNANALRTDYEGIAYDFRVDVLLIESIIKDFDLFVFEGDTFGSLSVQKRIDERDSKSVKARESAHKRWTNANAMQSQCEGNAIKESKGKEIKERKVIKVNILDSAFDEWWNIYDKKVSKEKAISKWNILTNEEKQLALKIVQEYVNSTPDKTFRKDPTTYLNNKSFNDEIIIRNATTSYKPNVSERNFTQLASLKYIEPKRD